MTHSAQFLNPSDAARKLGISTKALRLYETRGLIAPTRTSSGWRTYGPDAMARASEIVALRALGLSLAAVANVLEGDRQTLERILEAHEKAVREQMDQLGETVAKISDMRAGLAKGQVPKSAHMTELLKGKKRKYLALELPWPWGGETFELHDIRPVNYITGPLGSGKTRLAKAIADAVPGGRFVGLEQRSGDAQRTHAGTGKSEQSRIDRAMQWLCDEGAETTDALAALVTAIETYHRSVLVIDLIEQGLDIASQEALIGYLRNRAGNNPPLFMMTRSTAILDLESVGPDEAIIYCPANHSPPMLVAPYPGATGFEAVATCLAPPDVRARTEGVVAMRP